MSSTWSDVVQLIRCTQKLQKKLPVVANDDVGISQESCWHANLIRIDHYDCLLITHDTTLFSLFVPGVTREDFQHFTQLFGQALFKTMRHFDFSQKQIEYMLDGSREIQTSKTNSRSVLGSMNDMKQMIDHTAFLYGGLGSMDMAEIFQVLNHTPFKAIGYNYPEEKMREMLGEV